MTAERFVLVGGAGFVGMTLAVILRSCGVSVTVVDRDRPGPGALAAGVDHIQAELLTDDVELPEGHVVLLIGNSDPRPRWPWTLPLDTAFGTARLLPQLDGREVTLCSSVEVYGGAPGPLREGTAPSLGPSEDTLVEYAVEIAGAVRRSCDPWRVANACRDLLALDRTGRWGYALSKRLQEILVTELAGDVQPVVLRLPNLFGAGQTRLVGKLTRNALAGRPLTVCADTARSLLPVQDVARAVLAGLAPGTYNFGCPPIELASLASTLVELTGSDSSIVLRPAVCDDSSGLVCSDKILAAGVAPSDLRQALERFVETLRTEPEPYFTRRLALVGPPRPARPDVVARRQQSALWTGALKHGMRWGLELGDRMIGALGLPQAGNLLLTTSGTEALRLAVVGTAGAAYPGDVAIAPSFAFPATAEVLTQLGYRIVFCDVDADTWTLDPEALRATLELEPTARVVVCLDTFGNPCDYGALLVTCREAGVPLVADSAAALGSRYQGHPVAQQADAHAFSMSFAKVISAGGAGGAVTFREPPMWDAAAGWTRSALISELHAIPALEELENLEDLVHRRELVAEAYEDSVSGEPGVTRQIVRPANRHSRVHWVMQVEGTRRAESIHGELNAGGGNTGRDISAQHLVGPWPSAVLPVTERLHHEVCALPMSSELTVDHAELVTMAVRDALARRAPDREQLLPQVRQ